MKKLLAICIIFLFIDVAVAPSINSSVVKPSDNLIEVTSQACGIQGFGNTQKKTVSLSDVEYHQLEAYLDEIQARLNASRSFDETKSLFKEALQKLGGFGLLPHGVSPESVYYRLCRNLPRHVPQSPVIGSSSQVKNYCCLVTGKATKVSFDRLILALLSSIFPAHFFLLFPVLLYYMPLGIGLLVGLGIWDYYYVNFPSVGTIYTYGLNGQYSNTGDLWGTLPLPRFQITFWKCAPALLGFTGIHIILSEEDFFLGSALVASYNVSAPPVQN